MTPELYLAIMILLALICFLSSFWAVGLGILIGGAGIYLWTVFN